MNWEAIGAIGEIIGATAVVVTLIYLAVQVRQGTRATQAVSIQTASALDQEWLIAVGTDAQTAPMWFAYLTSPESLTENQRKQGALIMGAALRRLENIYLQKRLGAISEEGWRSRQPMFRQFARSPGYRDYLKSIAGGMMSEEFKAYMKQLSLDDSDD